MYKLSEQAELDIEDILEFSLERFGYAQALAYSDGLEKVLELLGRDPHVGELHEWIAEGVRRFCYQVHSIYYVETMECAFILRVIHQRRDIDQIEF